MGIPQSPFLGHHQVFGSLSGKWEGHHWILWPITNHVIHFIFFLQIYRNTTSSTGLKNSFLLIFARHSGGKTILLSLSLVGIPEFCPDMFVGPLEGFTLTHPALTSQTLGAKGRGALIGTLPLCSPIACDSHWDLKRVGPPFSALFFFTHSVHCEKNKRRWNNYIMNICVCVFFVGGRM